MNLIHKGILASTLAASGLVSTASPVMARDYYRDRGDNTAAVAIGAGIIGLAVGAIAASSNNRDDRYYDRRYYRTGDGYYRDNRSYYRNDRYYDRSRRYDSRDWNSRSRYDDRYYSRRGY
ncbi:hypothetical protein HNO88_001546 [Novosphingobium chloroacetimidivorans]|uniref:Uncharacterized protein n=1 Tax=Novosphingobium chloroacetimidivorans TaxID=1428314 RepID=A0A7W7K8J4_9SPHN|nr:hypothetical protein [Novosphingobium chloroacetimidivorans]MBB4858227.1 hypothetical protein [Novosphingobium chloroacetimidivorans]